MKGVELNATAKRRRERVEPIRVCCTAVERETIKAQAEAVGLSASAYLRRVGLGYKPRSMIDVERVAAMLDVAGDAGRLGGLLKMWLTDDERLATFKPRDMRPVIAEVLKRIGDTQIEIRAVAETVLKARE